MLKTIIVAVGLTMATTSYGLSEEWEEYFKIRRQLNHRFSEDLGKTPENVLSLKRTFCVDSIALLLATVRKVQTKRGATEEEIKRAGRKEVMSAYIDYENYEAAKLAAIRGEYFEYLERARKWKLCQLNAYEELTGETI